MFSFSREHRVDDLGRQYKSINSDGEGTSVSLKTYSDYIFEVLSYYIKAFRSILKSHALGS